MLQPARSLALFFWRNIDISHGLSGNKTESVSVLCQPVEDNYKDTLK